jgi:hypothetical protein
LQSRANEVQVGGAHYKSAKNQHWDFAADNRLGYFEGQITKYIARWRRKNGVQDLKKALHFATKLMELFNEGHWTPTHHSALVNFGPFAVDNELSPEEGRVCALMGTYNCMGDLMEVKRLIMELIDEANAQFVHVNGNQTALPTEAGGATGAQKLNQLLAGKTIARVEDRDGAINFVTVGNGHPQNDPMNDPPGLR